MSVGKDLLDVPFAALVLSLAKAIAQGQTALDKASLATVKTLATQTFEWIPEVTEVLAPTLLAPVTTVDPSGNPITIVPTGVTSTFTAAPAVPMTLLQAGMFPTFYQFTESVITVKMAISQKTSATASFDYSASTSFDQSFGLNFDVLTFSESVAYSSTVDFKTSNTYSYSAEGSSSLTATLKPVPPPSRVTPRFITVNALVSPPQVTGA